MGMSDTEELGQFGCAVRAEVVQFEQVLGMVRLQLRLLAAQPSFGLGDLHAFTGPQSNQVSLKLCDHCEHVKQQPADRVGWVVDRAAEAELDVPFGQLIQDVAGIGQRAGKPVQLGHYEGVARSAGRERQS